MALSILVFILDDFHEDDKNGTAILFAALALGLMGLSENRTHAWRLKIYWICMALYFLELFNQLSIYFQNWGSRLNYYSSINLFASVGYLWALLYFSFRALIIILPLHYAYLLKAYQKL
ncbi:MAG: hypothetical protein NXI09_05955 [Bacteroidetes bacterium]|nr:hypothetical protein [Bacteroidota bacterium]